MADDQQYTAKHSISYPEPTSKIKDADVPAKLAADIEQVAKTTDAALTLEGERAQAEAVTQASRYTQRHGEELAAAILANDYVRGRATAQRQNDSVWRHSTDQGQMLALGYAADGHLDSFAKKIFKEDAALLHEYGRHPVYAYAITTPANEILLGFRWDGGIDAPGLGASALGLVLDTSFPVGGAGVRPALPALSQWVTIGSSSSQHFGAAIATEVAGLGVDLAQMGKAGEWIEHIEARWGSDPAQLTVAGGSIPPSGSIEVFSSNVPPSANMKPFTGWLQGVHGTLSSTATAFSFSRTTAGDPAVVSGQATFIPELPISRRSGLLINDSGKNNLSTAGSTQRVISGTRRMLEHLAPLSKRFVVIDHFVNWNVTPSSIQAQQVREVNESYYAEYGQACIRRSDYLASTDIWEDTGITPTGEDLRCQAERLLPPSLSKDAAHMSDAAHLAFYRHVFVPQLTAFGWI